MAFVASVSFDIKELMIGVTAFISGSNAATMLFPNCFSPDFIDEMFLLNSVPFVAEYCAKVSNPCFIVFSNAVIARRNTINANSLDTLLIFFPNPLKAVPSFWICDFNPLDAPAAFLHAETIPEPIVATFEKTPFTVPPMPESTVLRRLVCSVAPVKELLYFCICADASAKSCAALSYAVESNAFAPLSICFMVYFA